MTADVLAPALITEAGVYPDLPAEHYHADPVLGGSLSSTGARTIARPGGPARYRWEQDHPAERKITDAMRRGILAHHEILGDLDDRMVLVDGDDWRGARAQARKEIEAAGKSAMLQKELDQVHAMAEAIAGHPLGRSLIQQSKETPEQTLIWQDDTSGVWCRARFDQFRARTEDRRLIIVDYKTARDASYDGFARASAEHGYDQQDHWYRSGAIALGLDSEPAFLFVVQESEPPYLVNVLELDGTAKTIGMNKNRGALNVYAEGRRTGRWRGYGGQVTELALPDWYVTRYGERNLPTESEPPGTG